MNLRDTFARNLRRLRADKGISQEELAFRANISRGYMSDLERSVYSASLDTVEALAKVLVVEPARLLERSSRRR